MPEKTTIESFKVILERTHGLDNRIILHPVVAAFEIFDDDGHGMWSMIFRKLHLYT